MTTHVQPIFDAIRAISATSAQAGPHRDIAIQGVGDLATERDILRAELVKARKAMQEAHTVFTLIHREGYEVGMESKARLSNLAAIAGADAALVEATT